MLFKVDLYKKIFCCKSMVEIQIILILSYQQVSAFAAKYIQVHPIALCCSFKLFLNQAFLISKKLFKLVSSNFAQNILEYV